MFKKFSFPEIVFFMIVSLIGIIFFIITGLKDGARKPYWTEIEEYQPTITPDMMISILPDERYKGKSISDWKLDELANAMAKALSRAPNRPMGYGTLIVQMDTTETEIDPYVRLSLGNENFDEKFIVYFRLSIMRDGEPFASGTFVGEELIQWAKSVGIADKKDWH